MTAALGRPAQADSMAGYVDPVAVERACWGQPVRLRKAELTAAVQRLTRQGLVASAIAERVGVCTRTVVRHRSAPTVEVSSFG